MGVRESLLNTITSVADSDFVRIVTSAGASSKATVRNLFKGFESNLGAKSSLTTSDYVRIVGSDNEAYKQSVSGVADVIIPTTAKRFADGADASAQSVYGLYYCGSWTNSPSGAPAAGYLLVLPHGAAATNYRKQIYSPYNNNNLFIRTMNGGTWSAWEQMPTRAEMNSVQLNLPSAFSVRGKTYAEHIEAQVNNNRLPYGVPFLGVCEFYENGMALITGYIYISNSKVYGSVLVSGATATVSCRCVADTWTQVAL